MKNISKVLTMLCQKMTCPGATRETFIGGLNSIIPLKTIAHRAGEWLISINLV
jgi:hypothetical protein